jgi:hypothetical protein
MSEMALTPNIPTSFVPRAGAIGERHISADFGTALSFIAYILFVLVVFLAIGIFFYGRILTGTIQSKNAELAKAEAAIDPATVEGFVKLRDRLTESKSLLAAHFAPSGFFAALEAVIPASVRFTGLHLAIDANNVATVEGAGVAKNFNALSAASTAFATDGRIKDVIFSKMTINRLDNSVSFNFSATLDPSLTAFNPAAAPLIPAGTASTTSL